MDSLSTEHGDTERAGELAAGLVDVVYAMRLEPDAAFEYVSPSVERLVGYSPAEHYADPQLGMKLLHPDDVAVLLGAAKADIGQVVDITVRWLAKDGHTVWTQHRCIKQRRDDGSVVLFGAARDVTVQRELELRLADSEARLRQTVDSSPIGLAVIAVDGTLLQVNPALCVMLGRSEPELMTMDVSELTFLTDVGVDSELRRDVLEGRRETYRVEKRYVRPAGGVAWGDLSVSCIRDEAGAVRHFIAQIVDITAAVDMRDRFRLLAEHASDVVVMAGPDGLVQWISPAFKNVTGWRPDQLVGKSFLEFIHPDDRTSIMARQRTLADGESASFEARLRLADGEYRWFASRVQPIMGDDGTIIGRVAAWRDIEGEHVAREALQASEAQYRRLADNATDLVYQSGPDRLISWISPSVDQTLGWSPGELLGTSMAELMHPEDRFRFEDVREQVFAGHVLDTSLLPAAWRFHAKDGHYVWMTVRTTSLFDDDGAPAGIIAGMSTVDDLVLAQETCASEAARRQAIVESLIDPHVLLQAVRDAAGAIVDFVYADANEAACEYNRTRREQLIGMRLLDLLPGQAGSGMLGLYADAVESGRPLVLNDYAYPHEVLREERRFDIRAARVGDALSFTWRDVTDRFTLAREMAESEERYRLLAENSSDVVLHSRDGIIAWISPSVADVLGGSPADWVGLRMTDLIHPDDLAAYATVQTAIEAGRRPTKRARIRVFDGSYHWIEAHARLYLDAAGLADGHIASLRIVDDLVDAEAELAYQAHFDALTGLAKREEALSRLSDAGRNRRSPGGECAVFFCDVDDFKSVNDAWGHVAGDEVLRTVAERILRSVRGGDTVARMGGDEFLVIADGVHDLDEAHAIAEKMRSAAAVPLALNGGGVRATLSIGVTLSLRHEPVDTVVSRADHAMYEAKHRGRNQVVAVPAPSYAETGE